MVELAVVLFPEVDTWEPRSRMGLANRGSIVERELSDVLPGSVGRWIPECIGAQEYGTEDRWNQGSSLAPMVLV